jgi:hypothetical protein
MQKTELFVGGLPEYLQVDVELRDPQDLQTAMGFRTARGSLAPIPAARIATTATGAGLGTRDTSTARGSTDRYDDIRR